MRERIIYEIKALYRDNFRVRGYEFGEGEKSVCIMGSLRGNEYQQIYTCSRIIRKLKTLEREGRITKGHGILVIPCGNPYSINIKKRFWSIDNTDINRMFPGYNLGETTQRIADGIFREISGYRYGIQFASFYMPGHFVPQVRIMKTGMENVEHAKLFGMPYVVLHHPRPFDTTTLNYNWQIWETEAYSIYTTSTSEVDKESAEQAVNAVLIFLAKMGILKWSGTEGYISRVVETPDFRTIRSNCSGFLARHADAGDHVEAGQMLAEITDPYLAETRQIFRADCEGTIAFASDETMVYENTAVFKIIPD